jgi:hypothetical protein
MQLSVLLPKISNQDRDGAVSVKTVQKGECKVLT